MSSRCCIRESRAQRQQTPRGWGLAGREGVELQEFRGSFTARVLTVRRCSPTIAAYTEWLFFGGPPTVRHQSQYIGVCRKYGEEVHDSRSESSSSVRIEEPRRLREFLFEFGRSMRPVRQNSWTSFRRRLLAEFAPSSWSQRLRRRRCAFAREVESPDAGPTRRYLERRGDELR